MKIGPIENSLKELPLQSTSKVVLVSDESLNAQQRHIESALVANGVLVKSFPIPSGERAKDISVLSSLWDFLGQESVTRDDLLIALGGGSTTDVVGFAAATWMRGIRYINIPTTLLAMVDASVGGKTAINSRYGKNLVGTFHMPTSILIDPSFLKTLPDIEISNGCAEIIKCGFIKDDAILELLEKDEYDFPELIRRAIAVKEGFVQADPNETQSGVREILNYGHTLGHALEKRMNYEMSHGQAIAIGMMFVAEVSHALGLIDTSIVDRHQRLFEKVGLATRISGVRWNDVLPYMLRDKKNRSGHLRIIVLRGIGSTEVIEDVDMKVLESAYAKVCL